MLRFTDDTRFGRRTFLQIGSLGGLTLPMLLRARALAAPGSSELTTGKSVVLLMCHGGPSQIETFDPKMTAPSEYRSATGEVQTTVPGLTFGGTFPRLARYAHRLAIVRSYQSGSGAHTIHPIVSTSSLNANIGSIYSRVVGPIRPDGMPTNVAAFPSAVADDLPGARTNFGRFTSTGSLGPNFAPFVPGGGGQLQQDMQLHLPRERIDDRRRLLQEVSRIQRQVELLAHQNSIDQYHEQAFDVVLGGVADAFNLRREDPRLVARYDTSHLDRPRSWQHKNNKRNYTAHAKSLGKLLLLARRLCERGVGFVTISTEFVWDMHQDRNNLGVREGMDLVGTPFDVAVSTFIEDVEARGLSDRILLVATGEMGRTPKINNRGGRDHWGRLTPLLIYGGGMTRGQVIGRSDRNGGQPATTPITGDNLVATILHTLFNTTAVRLADAIPSDVSRLITDGRPIPGLPS